MSQTSVSKPGPRPRPEVMQIAAYVPGEASVAAVNRATLAT